MSGVVERSDVVARPSGAALAADIEGVDLSRELSPETVEDIKKAWSDHLVLRFRGQRLDDEALMRFSRHFGELDRAPVIAAAPVNPRAPLATGARNSGEDGRERRPPADRGEEGFVDSAEEGPRFVSVISNIVEGGRAIGALGAYESFWHTDMSYHPEPPSASALYALEVPLEGGDTGFASMVLAFERLPEALRRQVEGRLCRHDSSTNSAGERRRGASEVTDPREAPGAEHPIVRTHPVSGKKALFLGRRRNAYILGLQLEESERLLDALFAHATEPQFCWVQKWRGGDLVLWDNRAVMHRRDAFDPKARRLMHRTQIKGDRPY
jgi:alpha-ketoglutarate-dependent taurine dioxygenase